MAVSVPVAAGVKVTETVQLALTASVAPHVVVSPNELAFVPLIVIEAKFRVAVPVFVSVTVCAALELPT